jgi:hypothetical protein
MLLFLPQEYIYSFKYGEDGVQFGLKATNKNQDAGTYNSKGKVGVVAQDLGTRHAVHVWTLLCYCAAQ